MIVVLHRQRSEQLAQRLTEAIAEQGQSDSWADLEPEIKEIVVRAFDALIQDGLIAERQLGPQSRVDW